MALFKAGVLGMDAVTKRLTLADVFVDDSENERTFYGFSDSEISDHCDKVSAFKCRPVYCPYPASNWKNKQTYDLDEALDLVVLY